jgi:hypothetical protein
MKIFAPVPMTCLGALLGLVSIPSQAAVEVNESTDISLSVFVPCAAGGVGEIVDLSGPLHTLITFTINNEAVSGVEHFQPQGISGFGETTGTKYQATGVTSTSFKFSLQNGQANETFINRFLMIGAGPGNNFLVRETAHFTFNASGTVTVFFDDFSVECK